MPGQNIEKQKPFGLKELNMAPSIPQNNSQEQLMSHTYETSSTPEESTSGDGPTLKDVKIREWIAMLILCFVNLINYMDRFTIAGILKDIQDYFDISNDMGGLLQTSFVISYMVFAPLFGYLGDRYSRKTIMALGVALWSITTLAGSFMTTFGTFIIFRALVGIGEASYSTIAPTIISDLFVKDVRSKMLALFYFAIPVGSGLGYIVGSETAAAMGSWHWALRVTPGLGLIAVLLIAFVLQDPERGQSEGSGHLTTTAWKEDLKDVCSNPSFIFSTAGFTCVSFVAGALAWWGPNFIYMGIRLQPGNSDIQLSDVSYKFGIIAMISGLLGVPAGSMLAQKLRPLYPRVDPNVCGFGMLLSAPMIFLALVTVSSSAAWCYVFVFFGEFFLNLSWSIVADILLYVVLPTRRSTAEGFQLLVSHALGDAGSPYLIGVVSDALQVYLTPKPAALNGNLTESAALASSRAVGDSDWIEFRSLQYALFITCFVEVLGGIFFLINAFYIIKDKQKVEQAVKAASPTASIDQERRGLMS